MGVARTVRTTLLWTHLLMGTTAGVVILIMSVTGVLLAYEHQIVEWTDAYPVSASTGVSRVSLDVLVANARTAKPGVNPSMVALSVDPTKPASVRLGREGMLYLDPYTGRVLGTGSARTHALFSFIEGWHRWLGASAAKFRAMGKMATDACNLVFLFIVITGAYLWWPRQWNARALRRVAIPEWRLRGKARDFNWHNAIGLWSVVPLFAVVLSAVFMSYQWPSKMVNQLAGAPPDRTRGEQRDRGFGGGALLALAPGQLDAFWAQAQLREPGWKSATFRLPTERDKSITFTLNRSNANRPNQRTTVEIDLMTGRVKPTNSSATSPGMRARMWARFIHTGEAFGIIGQTIAMLASLGAVFLVWTGISLTLRRNAAWRARRARAAEEIPSAAALG